MEEEWNGGKEMEKRRKVSRQKRRGKEICRGGVKACALVISSENGDWADTTTFTAMEQKE